MVLFEHADTAKVLENEGCLELSVNEALVAGRDLAKETAMTNNYPDLVPRTCSRKLSLREHPDDIHAANAKDENSSCSSSIGVMSENFFLLAILLGTCILLYFFPPGPWDQPRLSRGSHD